MRLTIFGPGCRKCRKLAGNVEAAANDLGIDHELEKVSCIDDIVSAGIMLTPALAFDGKVVLTGDVLDTETIKKMLLQTISNRRERGKE